MNILTKIGNFAPRTGNHYLILACFMAGAICILVLMATGKYTGMFIQDFLISWLFFFFGFSSVPMTIRQDSDFGLIRFEGRMAIVLGLVLMVYGFRSALMPLWA